MSYYDSNGDCTSWKHHPNNADNDYENNYTSNDASSPSYNYNATDDDNFHRTEIAANGNIENNNFNGEYDGTAAGTSNSYFHNNHLDNANNGTIAANPVEEESQVVPVSLDHLSRDELCRMIYRLDYERNTLQDQLAEALRNQSNLKSNNGSRKKGKKRTRAATSSSQPRPQHQELLTHEGDQAPSSAEDRFATMPATAIPPPTPLEIAKIQKRLGQNLTAAIKQSAVHGLRKIPKSTISEGEMTLSTISAILQNYDEQKISDTIRMIKWNLSDDRDIRKLLKMEERLIHPVKHDGKGHILPLGSSPSNVHHWAKFVALEVRYDKRELQLTLIAKTMGAGSGRPENVPEKVRYSRGETQDLPGEF